MTGELMQRTDTPLTELKAVVDLLGHVMSAERADRWLGAPNPALAHQRPVDLVADGRCAPVIHLLHRLATGGPGAAA